MADKPWTASPANMESYLKYLESRDDAQLDQLARLIESNGEVNEPIVQYEKHMMNEVELEGFGDLDRPRIARLTGERIAEMKEKGFKGSDREALFIARRDVVQEEFARHIGRDDRDIDDSLDR